MFLVNYVYYDEELLEPYEWQEDDEYKEYYYLPIYRVSKQVLHDFMYCQLYIKEDMCPVYIVSDGIYSVVVAMKDHHIDKRGTVDYEQRQRIMKIVQTLSETSFDYQILEEAYEKEYGLTRQERIKKIYLEEVIDEIFVVHYELFQDICHKMNVYEEEPSLQYRALKQKIEKGYSSLHELLYKELIQKR
jgi:hypothetical protein